MIFFFSFPQDTSCAEELKFKSRRPKMHYFFLLHASMTTLPSGLSDQITVAF